MNEKHIDYIIKHMPEIVTPRLLLRKLKVKDAKDMYEYSSSEDLTRFLLWNAHPDLNYTKKYLKFVVSKYKSGDYLDWGIVLKENNKLIGTCGFTCIDLANSKGEIGYVLNPRYHNNGYATEAVRAVLKYAFDILELNRIEARVMEGNSPSVKLLENCSMFFEGVGRKEMFVKGEYKNILHFSLLRTDNINR